VEVGAEPRPYRPDAGAEYDGPSPNRPSPSPDRPSNHDQKDPRNGRDGGLQPSHDSPDPDDEARAAMREGA
jgi:hypothetical protein